MANRVDFTEAQRQSALIHNRLWLRDHRIDGVLIEERCEPLRERGQIYHCENCLFCHTDVRYFDVDHLVPDAQFKLWGKHRQAGAAVNMIILCKSQVRGDYGCNQSKSSNLWVPKSRGLAFSRRALDMNCYPLQDRPYRWA